MKKLFEKVRQLGKSEQQKHHSTIQPVSDPEVLEQYRIATKNINIESQPFRLSGLLHILTNKVSQKLKEYNHKLHYDIEQNVSRYIVGDNDYIEQILEPLLKQLIYLNNNSEIILHISKENDNFIVFDVSNPNASMSKTLYKQYEQAEEQNPEERNEVQNMFIKAKLIAESMGGTLKLENSMFSGTHFIFKLPYVKDKDSRSNQGKLQKTLQGKRALFIDKTDYATKRLKYILKAFGLQVEKMDIEKFERSKPNFNQYELVIIRSADLSPKHINFFQNLQKKSFKLIILHEMFEQESKISMTKSIADAELYKPTIIGDVEEILNQMYIFQNKAVTGINNIDVFDPSSFILIGDKIPSREDLEEFKGAHIAVVEDSKVDMRVTKHILNIEGVKLFPVSNGQEMLDLLEKEEIDIIFTDVNMPVMDGLAMTKKIRSEPKWKDIPVISISSMSFPHELKGMQTAGMNAAIVKPVSLQGVYFALKRFLKITPAIHARYAKKTQKHHAPTEYGGNPKVLDVKKGIHDIGGKLQYLELLNETMEVLQNSQKELEELIANRQYNALKLFAQSMITLYNNIHAKEMAELFNEILVYVASSAYSKDYLSDYIQLYTKKRQRLEKEIDTFREHLLNEEFI